MMATTATGAAPHGLSLGPALHPEGARSLTPFTDQEAGEGRPGAPGVEGRSRT